MTNLFDYAADRTQGAQLCTQEILEGLLDNPRTVQLMEKIRAMVGERYQAGMTKEAFKTEIKKSIDPLKGQLPVLIAQGHSTTGVRKNDQMEESQLMVMDYDYVANPVGIFQQRIVPQVDRMHIYMVYVSPSMHGLKIVSQRPTNMTLSEAEEWFESQVGIGEHDVMKDRARCSYLCSRRELLLYRPEQMFQQEMESFVVNRSQKDAVEEIPEAIVLTEAKDAKGWQNTTSLTQKMVPTFRDVPLTAIRDALFARWGYPNGPVDGNRNNLIFDVVRHLACLDSSMATLRAVVPMYGLAEQEYTQALQQGIIYRFKKMPDVLEEVISEQRDELNVDKDAIVDAKKSLKIPHNLPRFYKLILKKFPSYQHPSILAALHPLTGTLASRARVKSNNNVLNALSSQVCVVGEWGCGKDCIDILQERIMRPIKAIDDINREKEAEYMENKDLALNKESQPKKPHLPIRLLSPNTSKVMMMTRMKDADGLHCLLFTTEIQEMTDAQGLSYAKIEPILRKSFDKDGGMVTYDTASSQSMNMNIKARLNCLFCGTHKAVRGFYKDPEGGGPSRVTFTIMESRLGLGRPVYKDWTPEEEKEIDGYLDMLMNEPEMDETPYRLPMVEKALAKWQDGFNKEFNNKQADSAKLRLTYRAYDIALRAAVEAFIVNGHVEDKSVVNYALYIANLTVENAYTLFAHQLNAKDNEQHQREENKRQYSTPVKDLLNVLPTEFTRQDLIQERRKQGANNPDAIYCVLSRWKSGGYIMELEEKGHYRKLRNA